MNVEAPPDACLQRAVQCGHGAGRGFVEHHQINGQALVGPERVRPEQLIEHRQAGVTLDAQQDDRTVAGNAAGPQRRAAADP